MTTRRGLLGRAALGLAAVGLIGLAAGGAQGAIGAATRTVYIVAEVPEGTGDVWITGSSPVLGPWRANGSKMYADGSRRIYALEAREGFQFEYKFTLGSWETEALGAGGETRPANNRLTVGEREVYLHTVPGFMGR